MQRSMQSRLAILLITATSIFATQVFAAPRASKPSDVYGRLRMNFEENHGQTDAGVRFLSRGAGYTIFLTASEAVLSLRGDGATEVLRMQMVGANKEARIEGIDRLSAVSNYLVGNDARGWRTNVPNYARVRYHALYEGIDLVYYGNGQLLEYDFIVAPGSDPGLIRLRMKGARKIGIDAAGDLHLRLDDRQLRLLKPVAYQVTGGVKTIVPARYVLRGRDQIAFSIGDHDRSQPLIIDPTLIYSTYIGGTMLDRAFDLVVNASDDAYITGETASADFPQEGIPLKPPPPANQMDAFVSKLYPDGTGLEFSTYLGSNTAADRGLGIAIGPDKGIWITGITNPGMGYPTTAGAFQPTPLAVNSVHGFITKLHSSGSSILYSSFMDGSNVDEGWSVAVDAMGNAYVAGRTASANFPVTLGSAAQPAIGGIFDAFLLKIDPSKSGQASLLYCTFFGGSQDESGDSLAIDEAGNAYITGDVVSIDYPIKNGFQTIKGSGRDAYLLKINPAISGPAGWLYSTHIGGNGNENDTARDGGVAVDQHGNAYVVGTTTSDNLHTTPGSFQEVYGDNGDVFVARIDTTQVGPASLLFLTYLGGSAADYGKDVVRDRSGSINITGSTSSANFPTTPCPFAKAAGSEIFVAVLNEKGNALLFGTYLGGAGGDSANGIAVDNDGVGIYVAGETSSADFPTSPNALQPTIGGLGSDAYIAKLVPSGCADLKLLMTDSPDPVNTGSNLTYTITLINDGPTAASAPVVKDTLPFNASYVPFSCSTTGICYQSGSKVIFEFPSIAAGASETMTLDVQPSCSSGNATLQNSAKVTSLTSDPLMVNNSVQVLTSAKNPPPVVFCPANQNVISPTSPTVVNYPAATATDNCPGVTVSCVPPSGSAFPNGVTTVTCTATDSAGAKASCTFTVNVQAPIE